jgi:hypothetical protein
MPLGATTPMPVITARTVIGPAPEGA